MNKLMRSFPYVVLAVSTAVALVVGLWLAISGSAAHAADPASGAAAVNKVAAGQVTVTVPVTWTQRNEDGFGLSHVRGVQSFAVFDGQLYAATSAWDGSGARRLFRSDDGLAWEEVIGSEFERLFNYEIQALAVYSDYLYAGTSNFNWFDSASEGAEIWRSADGLDWSVVITGGMGDAQQAAVNAFAEFDGYLYAGTHNITQTQGAEIWRSADGADWEKTVTGGLNDDNASSIRALYVYSDVLFAGLSNYADGAEVWRSEDGLSWTRVMTGGFDGSDRPSVTGLTAFGDHLYAYLTGGDGVVILRCQTCAGNDWVQVNEPGFGNLDNMLMGSLVATQRTLFVVAGNGESGIEVWQTQDGENWQPVGTGGFGDANNIYLDGQNGIALFADRLFVGTWNEETGGEIWSYYLGPTFLVEVERNANLRGGPGTNFPIIGRAKAGDILEVVGQNEDESWYQLGNDAWIAAFLVLPLEAEPEESTDHTAAALPITATAAITDPNDIRSIILGAGDALTNESWRMHSEIVFENGKSQVAEIEYAPADRYRMVFEQGLQLILIGEEAWVREGNEWTKSDIDIPISSILGGAQLLKRMADDFEVLGVDELNGQDMFVYRCAPTDSSVPTCSGQTWWIGMVDYHVYKIAGPGKALSVNSGREVDVVVTHLFVYDPEISVEPPVE